MYRYTSSQTVKFSNILPIFFKNSINEYKEQGFKIRDNVRMSRYDIPFRKSTSLQTFKIANLNPTTMCTVEQTLLTSVSDDPEDLRLLTTNHFLLGQENKSSPLCHPAFVTMISDNLSKRLKHMPA